LQDPFIARSVMKPRGYAGDAVLLDFIYYGLPAEFGVSDLGRSIFHCTAGASGSAVAVRERKNLLSGLVDAAATRARDASILSVACGHLREAEDNEHFRAGTIAQYVALDQDAVSLESVAHRFAGTNVRPVQSSVRDILTKPVEHGPYDLIYAAGLYDYLGQPVARQLTERLFDGLKPGGELFVANFAHGFATHAFMQAYMDWRLICRDEDALRDLVATIAPTRIASHRTFRGDNGYVNYLSVFKSR
jgi:extracellular factor (EF) 3-hydroxypalmitic acid methyl ester biosynthesis protein